MTSRLATDRNRSIVSGAVGLVILFSLVTIGIKGAFGAFEGGYEIRGTFAAAGQGLISGSDVKIRGVNVGEVDDIELVENQAVITMRIKDDARIPETAQAIIRPKTLFGEKFVDLELGDDELEGPYLADGDEIEDTLGGFELERVLADTYPILKAIDPAEVAVVLDELATAGDGLGENINRSIVNGAVLAEMQASNDAEVRQFLGDLALLSEELDRVAPDLVAGARDLNVALPSLNARSERLNAALRELSGLSSDVADLLDRNREFTETALTDGSRALNLLFERRSRIQPLLLGLQRYTQTLSEAIRAPVGDGSLMATVKAILEEPPVPLPGGGDGGGDDGEGPLPPLPLPPLPIDPTDPLGGVLDPLDDTVDDLLGRGGRSGGTSTTSTTLLDILLGGGG